jgi:protein ImuB
MAEKHFPEPIARIEDMIAVLGRLAEDVGHALHKRGAGGRVFEASVFRSDGMVRRIRVETAQATRDAGILMRLMRLRIEALADPLDPGFGFDALRLAVLRGEPLREAQPDLETGAAVEDEARAVGDLVNRLVARFGRENVQRFMTHDTHDPARAGVIAPYLSEASSGSWSEPEPGEPPLRPLTLFVPPQPIEVMAEAPDSPPMKFRWRRALHDVASAEGPERIAPEWWAAQPHGPSGAPASEPPTRDYYRVEDAHGHRFWIFREGLYQDSAPRPRWFMHGLFA